MRLYNLFPTLAGPFAQWDRHLARAADMGFDALFVNPIQRPGASGSLYSIADYFALNPALADPAAGGSPEEQARAALRRAREQYGLRPVVDLVINHCAADAALLREHPPWFLWEDGRPVHPSCDENGRRVVWEDLARFNHANTRDPEGLHDLFYRIARYLLDLGFSGFRCDAAYQVPRATWQRLMDRVRAERPDVLFIAETLGCTPDQTRETAAAGFDYVFNSGKWWDFQSHWLMAQYGLIRDTAPSIGFPESHDTPRLAAETNGNAAALRQRYLFAALFSAGVMMPIGYEFGFRKPLHVVQTRPSDWEENTGLDLRDFIRAVNAVKSAHEVFQGEHPTELLDSPNPNVLVMWKGSTRTREEALLLLNKDVHNRQGFRVDTLRRYVQSGGPLVCVSPENPLPFVPEPFDYELRPGEAVALIGQR